MGTRSKVGSTESTSTTRWPTSWTGGTSVSRCRIYGSVLITDRSSLPGLRLRCNTSDHTASLCESRKMSAGGPWSAVDTMNLSYWTVFHAMHSGSWFSLNGPLRKPPKDSDSSGSRKQLPTATPTRAIPPWTPSPPLCASCERQKQLTYGGWSSVSGLTLASARSPAAPTPGPRGSRP